LLNRRFSDATPLFYLLFSTVPDAAWPNALEGWVAHPNAAPCRGSSREAAAATTRSVTDAKCLHTKSSRCTRGQTELWHSSHIYYFVPPRPTTHHSTLPPPDLPPTPPTRLSILIPRTTPSSTSMGAAPTPLQTCVHCGATETPLWRAGPAGPKTLCNACGVRWKKTGSVVARGRRRPAPAPKPKPVAAGAVRKPVRKPVTAQGQDRPLIKTSPPQPVMARFAAPIPSRARAQYESLFSGLMVVRARPSTSPARHLIRPHMHAIPLPLPSPSPPPGLGMGLAMGMQAVYVTEMHAPSPSPSPPPLPRYSSKGFSLLLAAAAEAGD
jgi:GATA zinc finger